MKLMPLFVLVLVSCVDKESDLKSEGQGAASSAPIWFKTPAEIRNTIENTLMLPLSTEEVETYIDTIGSLYGNFSENEMTVTLTHPNGAYLLGLDVVSSWLSSRLVQKQFQTQLLPDASDESYPLFGKSANEPANPYESVVNETMTEEQCNACYADNKKKWCDCPDGVVLGEFHRAQFYESTSDLATKHKRIMHNIQDIGEFIGVPIDNMSEPIRERSDNMTYNHAAAYLLLEVFLPALEEQDAECPSEFQYLSEDGGEDGGEYEEDGGEGNQTPRVCSDFTAWQRVVHAMLMSAPFFVHLDTTKREEELP